jgi:lipoate-protein ligase A
MPHGPSIDFKKINSEIILNSFKSLGINAQPSGRNDILVDGKKVNKISLKVF